MPQMIAAFLLLLANPAVEIVEKVDAPVAVVEQEDILAEEELLALEDIVVTADEEAEELAQ